MISEMYEPRAAMWVNEPMCHFSKTYVLLKREYFDKDYYCLLFNSNVIKAFPATNPDSPIIVVCNISNIIVKQS